MALLSPDPKDVAAIRDAASQVIKDAIGQLATVLVPVIADAAKSSMAGLSVNITVDPIKLSIEIGEKQ